MQKSGTHSLIIRKGNDIDSATYNLIISKGNDIKYLLIYML